MRRPCLVRLRLHREAQFAACKDLLVSQMGAIQPCAVEGDAGDVRLCIVESVGDDGLGLAYRPCHLRDGQVVVGIFQPLACGFAFLVDRYIAQFGTRLCRRKDPGLQNFAFDRAAA